mmetsp:Transcript_23522/g.93233  ORF Transcript_23522/g.93233 Transcript_23522/m.93233 type:complete len:364 (-) Transcript_23522:206-1297(-)
MIAVESRARRPLAKTAVSVVVIAHALLSHGSQGFSMIPTTTRLGGGRRHQELGATTTLVDTPISLPTIDDAKTVTFSKYHGLGNDFILVDNRGLSEPVVTPTEAAQLCDRNFGVGADGVIFVMDADDAANDLKMRIYNSDSSEPEMCGNGIRCLARFASAELGLDAEAFRVETGAGLIVPELLDTVVRVDMGEPELVGAKVPCTLEPTDEAGRVVDAPLVPSVDKDLELEATAVSMGNPHAVMFVDNLDALDFERLGPLCEAHAAFPARVNAEFVEVVDARTLRMRVWERGAGPTLACGTGACAVLVAAVLTGRAERDCVVRLPGGDLRIEWREEDNKCYMTGPAEFVFAGSARVPPVGSSTA